MRHESGRQGQVGGARRPQEPLGSLDIPWCSVKREALIVQRLLAEEAAKRGLSVAALGDGDGDITSGAMVPDQTVSEGVIRLSPCAKPRPKRAPACWRDPFATATARTSTAPRPKRVR